MSSRVRVRCRSGLELDDGCVTERLSEDVSELQAVLKVAQGCILLLILRQHLKDMFGFTDK